MYLRAGYSAAATTSECGPVRRPSVVLSFWLSVVMYERARRPSPGALPPDRYAAIYDDAVFLFSSNSPRVVIIGDVFVRCRANGSTVFEYRSVRYTTSVILCFRVLLPTRPSDFRV